VPQVFQHHDMQVAYRRGDEILRRVLLMLIPFLALLLTACAAPEVSKGSDVIRTPVVVPEPVVPPETPPPSAPSGPESLAEEQKKRYEAMRNCIYIQGLGYISLDKSKPCPTASKEARSSPSANRKTPSSNRGINCRGGEGPYQVIFSDNSTWEVYALSCLEALERAERIASPGISVVEIFPI